ncbi:MAG: hypothetical protein ABEH81_12625 [Halopenitus sp.]
MPGRTKETPARENVGFDSALAYALSPDMRRLIIVFLAGWFLSPIGFTLFVDPVFLTHRIELPRVLVTVAGLGVLVVAGALLFGGLVGALFKTITDANVLAAEA